MIHNVLRLWIGLIWLMFWPGRLHSQGHTIRLKEVFPQAGALIRPVDLKEVPGSGGYMVVVEQRGKAYLFHSQEQAFGRRLFLNLPFVSQKGNETGLLSLVFDPAFIQNRLFYVYYTRHEAGGIMSYVARYTMPASIDVLPISGEGEIVFSCQQPYANHNGGCLLFGPDNYLYISLGDGGSAGDPHNHSQNLQSVLGKILRIDVRRTCAGRPYCLPPDNPFVHDTLNARGEIYAYGLRNVWRMSFDSRTQKLWAGDVGQNAWEEINIIEAGKNYGWRIKEGFACYSPAKNCQQPGLTDPVYAYPQHHDDKSVTGGLVYHGTQIPWLREYYVYGDYVSGRIWALKQSSKGVEHHLIFDVQNPRVHISSFAHDATGELYVLSHLDGKILKIVP